MVRGCPLLLTCCSETRSSHEGWVWTGEREKASYDLLQQGQFGADPCLMIRPAC